MERPQRVQQKIDQRRYERHTQRVFDHRTYPAVHMCDMAQGMMEVPRHLSTNYIPVDGMMRALSCGILY